MRKGNLVVDSVIHGFDWSADNRAESCPVEMYEAGTSRLWNLYHRPTESLEPGFLRSYEETRTNITAEELESVVFDESDVDIAVYHNVMLKNFVRGTSPLAIGSEMKRRNPNRILLYAHADPFMGEAGLDQMEQLHAEHQLDGFKFYPGTGMLTNAEADAADGRRAATLTFDNEEMAYPFFSKAVELGVKHVAIHKAIPVGPGPTTNAQVDDIGSAARDFPGLTFEVVHSGWAFLDECIVGMMSNKNIYANIENVASFAVRQPKRFARIIGPMLAVGLADRILLGSGATLCHPQPIIDAIDSFEMPEEVAEMWGAPEFTEETKAKVLGLNALAMYGIDPAAQAKKLENDDVDLRRRERGPGVHAAPWGRHRARVASAAS